MSKTFKHDDLRLLSTDEIEGVAGGAIRIETVRPGPTLPPLLPPIGGPCFPVPPKDPIIHV